jgi:hypothetical protein
LKEAVAWMGEYLREQSCSEEGLKPDYLKHCFPPGSVLRAVKEGQVSAGTLLVAAVEGMPTCERSKRQLVVVEELQKLVAVGPEEQRPWPEEEIRIEAVEGGRLSEVVVEQEG